MPPRLKASAGAEALAQLQGRAQTALALDLVAKDKDPRAVRAALDVLRERPTRDARPILRARFDLLAADGVKRDAGTYLRAAILQALRPIADLDDLPLLERGVTTYEWLPPKSEEASLLRSTALVVMNELDSRLASYHAVRLLADEWNSRLSGEPGLTAVHVLAALDDFSPLYYYALHQPQPQSDVLSECLRSLTRLPATLLPGLIEKHGSTRDEVVMVGLLDLLLEHPAADTTFVRAWMASTDLWAVYHYLVSRLIAMHAPDWLALLADQTARERHPRKLALIEEALALGRPDPLIQAALTTVRHRRAAPTLADKDDADDDE
jgi:hypothetical protein